MLLYSGTAVYGWRQCCQLCTGSNTIILPPQVTSYRVGDAAKWGACRVADLAIHLENWQFEYLPSNGRFCMHLDSIWAVHVEINGRMLLPAWQGYLAASPSPAETRNTILSGHWKVLLNRRFSSSIQRSKSCILRTRRKRLTHD